MTSSSDIRQALNRVVPLVKCHWHRPLRDYSRALYETFERANTDVMSDAFERLCKILAVRAAGSGYCESEIHEMIETIRRRPVIQTGPHCYLMIEPDAFFTHLFSVMGLTAHLEKWYISYSVSTVKFIEKANKGPGWLWLDGQHVNVFGRSTSQLQPYSICGHSAAYRFVLKPANSQSHHPARDRLAAILPEREFDTAAEAIKTANGRLWRSCFGNEISFLQLDDTDISALVVDHLRDPHSWLSRNFIGDRELVSTFLRTVRKIDEGPWAGWIKFNTDFFWLLRDGRLKPLRLERNILCDEAGVYKAAFDRLSLADFLETGEIVPSLFMVFLVIGILPGLRALGGSRQTVYYPLMRQALLIALDRSSDPINASLAEAIRSDPMPSGWGHRTVAPIYAAPWQLFTADEPATLASLLEIFGSRSLEETSGELPGFVNDKLWSRLSQQLLKTVVKPSAS